MCVIVPKLAVIGNIVTEISWFFDFQDGGRVPSGWWPSAILNFKNLEILLADGCRGSRYTTMQNFVKMVNPLQRYHEFFLFFQYGGCPPSCICCVSLDHPQ